MADNAIYFARCQTFDIRNRIIAPPRTHFRAKYVQTDINVVNNALNASATLFSFYYYWCDGIFGGFWRKFFAFFSDLCWEITIFV